MKFRKIGASLLAGAMLVGSCLTASAAEVPPETCTVDYRPTSPTVKVTTGMEGETGIINLEITSEAEGDQVLAISDILMEMSSLTYMPGDTQNIKVNITNNSGHQYQYKSGSFVLSTPDTDEFGSLEEGSLLPMLGYDGQYLPLKGVGSMLPKYFYKDLFGVKDSAAVTFEMMCGIYEALEEKGYANLQEYLAKYYGYESWDEMVASDDQLGKKLFSSAGTNNGIFEMSEEYLLKMIEKYPWIDKYLYVQASGDQLKVQIKWPEAPIAGLSYDYFYRRLLFFAYGSENVAQLDPNGLNDFTLSHGVASYLPESAAYSEANTYFSDLLNTDAFKNGSTVSFDMAFALNGPEMNNQYQNYEFGYYNSIVLEQVDGDVTVSKVDPDGNAVNGAEFVVGRVVDGETQYLGYEGEWTADQQAAAIFISENGSFVIEKLPFGDYFLKETAAPEGYVLPTETFPFTVNEVTETVEVVNQLEEEEIPDESTPLTPPGEDGSTPPDDTEEIPDESNPLAPATGEASNSPVWFAVGMILAGCCVCALAVCRRKEARKQK
ncbi:MAG: prealbumin-like fold domain-containing protein [Hydrogeniiclostridium sp.]